MRSSGSRVDIAQKPNKSGQILDQRWKIFFVIFKKAIPRRIFYIANILVLMVVCNGRFGETDSYPLLVLGGPCSSYAEAKPQPSTPPMDPVMLCSTEAGVWRKAMGPVQFS